LSIALIISIAVVFDITEKLDDFMENQASWHGKVPNDEEYKKAIIQLEKE